MDITERKIVILKLYLISYKYTFVVSAEKSSSSADLLRFFFRATELLVCVVVTRGFLAWDSIRLDLAGKFLLVEYRTLTAQEAGEQIGHFILLWIVLKFIF